MSSSKLPAISSGTFTGVPSISTTQASSAFPSFRGGVATTEGISSGLANGAEYAGRNRSIAQFVGDLYSAFLRRGGDLSGVQFWIGQLGAGATRDSLRRQFIARPEFQGRVQAILPQGGLP